MGKLGRNVASPGTSAWFGVFWADDGACGFLTETDNSCKVCCRDEQDRCVPYVDANDQFLFLRKGKPCTVGFCDTNVSAPAWQRDKELSWVSSACYCSRARQPN